jgi:ATP-binding cassette subfamily B protein
MGMIAGERVFKVLDNDDVMPNKPTHFPALERSSEKMKGELAFENVSFGYTNEMLVLKNISFEVPAGKTIAIVGNTGSGKSTIIHLMNRLYQHTQGSIKIDNIPIQDYELADLRSQIAVVLQDVFLFNGSILDNLTLRNTHITRDRVIEATKMIDLHDFIMSLPGGYDFKVMERGATLSMGQRQLLSFARAILFNPSILILDEATSSIDSESEFLIQKAIDRLIRGRTSVVIAHRLSTIKKADKIMVLDHGEIREMGTHEQLLDQKGLYFQLYNTQFSKEMTSN